jgi:hypothetical protein
MLYCRLRMAMGCSYYGMVRAGSWRLLCCAAALLAVAAPLHAGACDSTRIQRDRWRTQLTSALTTTGPHLALASTGNYSCATAGGTGNPESVTCLISHPAASGGGAAATRWQLEKRDALVLIHCAPALPGPLYFGWTPYLVGFDLATALLQRPGGQLVDSLNQLVINSTKPGLPWGGTVAMIITADAVTDAAVSRALVSVGFPATAINTVVLPSALLGRPAGSDMGTGPLRDYFLFGARAGPFRTTKEESAFIASSASEPVLVYRAAQGGAPPPPPPFQPLPTPRRRVRAMAAGAATERHLLPARSEVERLVGSWAKAAGLQVRARIAMTPQLRDGVYSNGTECVSNRSTHGCFLDTDDACYYDSGALEALPADGIDVVIGANSYNTGMAAYSSVSAYTTAFGARPQGVAMDSLEYNGSVAQFAQSTVVGTPVDSSVYSQLFAVLIRSRPGNSSHSPGEPSCGRWCLNATWMARPHTVAYNTRAYLNPTTKTGPAPTDMLPPVVIRLRPVSASSFK